MSPDLFERIYKDIKDPRYGCNAFSGRKDACGRPGASALQKMVDVMRMIAYGTSADITTEYTGVKKNNARLAMYAFCKFINRAYGPEYLGRWGEGELKKEMEVNKGLGSQG